jgi:hypothetical protein
MDSEIKNKKSEKHHPLYHYAILRNHNILVEILRANYNI